MRGALDFALAETDANSRWIYRKQRQIELAYDGSHHKQLRASRQNDNDAAADDDDDDDGGFRGIV